MSAGPSQEQLNSAFTHLMDGVRRNDALPAREAAINALGPDATNDEIAAWIRKFRPEATEAA